MTGNRKIWHWAIMALLSAIWGTSYILMKRGLESFSYLQVGALRILFSFLCLLPIALKNLYKLNRQNLSATDHWVRNLGCIALLAVMGSAIALALFYFLIRETSPVFGSMVTYFIPIVSTLWVIADNERFTSSMLISVAVILAGVYIINRSAIKNILRT